MIPQRFPIRICASGRPLVSIDDFAIARDSITFLFGESGIGKSLLSQALYGLLDPEELWVEMNDRPYRHHLTAKWTKEIQKNSFFVFQEPSSHLNPLVKLNRQLTEGALRHCTQGDAILSYLWNGAERASIEPVLDIYPKPYRPSGGEKQRVLLAMAFKKLEMLRVAGRRVPTFFVFDEPTGSLDNSYRNIFLKLLFGEYSQFPFTGLVATHDYSVISEIYRSYRPVLDRIHFRELHRNSDGTVSLRDFAPDEYLSWLKNTELSQAPVAGRGAKVVLDTESRFTVFGRRFATYADKQHRNETGLTVRAGDMAYLKAPSGVGKTTLAKVLLGLIEAQEVRFSLDGITVTQDTNPAVWGKRIWGKKAGMVFQHADEALDLHATVRETFAGLPIRPRMKDSALRKFLGQLFDGAVPTSFLGKKVLHLSGGQKQRLNILRTLATHTPLIILDEPLNGLDFVSVKKVLGLLEEKRRAGAALLMISHNEEIFDALVSAESTYFLSPLTDKGVGPT